MKICVAQTRPVKGDIEANIGSHEKFIGAAVLVGTDFIIFPELSITGYEPELAKDLATTQNDVRFDVFQKISDANRITTGIGVPTLANNGTHISQLYFQPGKPREMYSKVFLHSSEEGYFVRGDRYINLGIDDTNIAPAICYELSVREHAKRAAASGADIYAVSVVEEKIERAIKRLTNVATEHSMTVMMANAIGKPGVYECPGKSSIWSNKGRQVGQLDDSHEGIFVFDTDTGETTKREIES
ncbi:MAG TPA: carbon-nitrogen hydrolase family protein [Candidatus Udaeobacter sp.]|nr:carbon-nitrogen hydrolase family protein [Candidatus Udaeobacter sp.]